MRTLYLTRHAKSSWTDSGLTDTERPLEKRGKKDAKNISKTLKSVGISPQIIVSSPAKRALSTARAFAKTFGFPGEDIQINNELYLPDLPTLLQVCSHLPEHERVMAVGHEPSFSEFLEHFVPGSLDKVRTSSVTEFVFDVGSWPEISKENLIRVRHWHRKNLEGSYLYGSDNSGSVTNDSSVSASRNAIR